MPLSACDGCGGSATFPTRDAAVELPVETGSLAIDASFDLCPTALLQASPAMVKVGESVAVNAQGSGVDGSVLTFSWTAPSGTFADPASTQTTFTCTEPGPVTVKLSVSDGSCTTVQSASVFCLAVPDGGSSGGGGTSGSSGGGGMGGGGGAGGTIGPNTCPAAEPTSGGPMCPQCTTDNCSLGPLPATDGCCGLSTEADQLLCEAAVACFASHPCTTAGDATNCFCGTSRDTGCFSLPNVANGPCVAQVKAAAKSSDLATIKSLLASQASPLGRAFNLTGCWGSFCSAECGIP